MMNSVHPGSDRPTVTVALMVQTGRDKPRLHFVDRDGFAIGSGDHCDLRLSDKDLPRWHSTVRVQGPTVWIEAADETAAITVNHQVFPRRALRDGDRLSFGETEIVISIHEAALPLAKLESPQVMGDLSQLSADELCTRIEQEESQVQEFNRRRRFGLQALLAAVEEVKNQDAGLSRSVPAVAAPPPLSDRKLDELVTQVKDLSETLDARSKALSTQELLMMESSAQLAEAQLKVSRQLEQLLTRLGQDDDRPGELRVSA